MARPIFHCSIPEMFQLTCVVAQRIFCWTAGCIDGRVGFLERCKFPFREIQRSRVMSCSGKKQQQRFAGRVPLPRSRSQTWGNVSSSRWARHLSLGGKEIGERGICCGWSTLPFLRKVTIFCTAYIEFLEDSIHFCTVTFWAASSFYVSLNAPSIVARRPFPCLFVKCS